MNSLRPAGRRRELADAGIQGVSGRYRARLRAGGKGGGAMFPTIDNPTTRAGSAKVRRQADLLPPLGATTEPPPSGRREVAKLIDVSKCIGCKACQVACLEWNELLEEVGVNVGVYDNPHDLTPKILDADALHRVRQPRHGQSRMADPQGWLHALRGSGLPQGLPGSRRHRAVLERHRRFRHGELHRLRLLREGLPLQHSAHLPGRPQGLQMHALLGPGCRRPGAGLRQGLPDPGDRFRHQGRDESSMRKAASKI